MLWIRNIKKSSWSGKIVALVIVAVKSIETTWHTRTTELLISLKDEPCMLLTPRSRQSVEPTNLPLTEMTYWQQVLCIAATLLARFPGRHFIGHNLSQTKICSGFMLSINETHIHLLAVIHRRRRMSLSFKSVS